MKKRTKARAGKGNHSLFPLSLRTFDHALNTLEKQAQWAYKQFKHTLPPKWERKLTGLTHRDIIHLALKKRNQITKEVKYFADGIVNTISRADILPDRNRLVKEAKKLAMNKGSELVSMLNFPTRKDVARLNVRLGDLEKSLRGLGKRPSAR